MQAICQAGALNIEEGDAGLIRDELLGSNSFLGSGRRLWNVEARLSDDLGAFSGPNTSDRCNGAQHSGAGGTGAPPSPQAGLPGFPAKRQGGLTWQSPSPQVVQAICRLLPAAMRPRPGMTVGAVSHQLP